MSQSDGDETPRVQRALAALRASGERVTPARCAVLRVLDAGDLADEHLTAEQVGARVARLEPSIHRATVYRTLTSLTDAGLLSHVHLAGSGTVYHLLEPEDPGDGGAGHPKSSGYAAQPASPPGLPAGGPGQPRGHPHGHAHVQCVACGKVFDVPPHTLDPVATRLAAELGFQLDTAHAALLGRCADCATGG